MTHTHTRPSRLYLEKAQYAKKVAQRYSQTNGTVTDASNGSIPTVAGIEIAGVQQHLDQFQANTSTVQLPGVALPLSDSTDKGPILMTSLIVPETLEAFIYRTYEKKFGLRSIGEIVFIL